MNSPSVSVVIPCYNAEKYIAASVLSAVNQTWENVEVIVVDDGSTDKSLDILQSFGGQIKLVMQKNQGACHARNVGFASSSGEYIKYLDADDILFPESIERQVLASMTLDANSFVYGRTFYLQEQTGLIRPHAYRDFQADNHQDISELIVDVPPTSAPLYSRGLVERIGGFDENVKKRQDFNFFVHAIIAGYTPIGFKIPVYFYRDHDSEHRITKKKGHEEYLGQIAMYQGFIDELAKVSDIERKREIERGLAKSMWIIARDAIRLGFKDVAATLFQLSMSCDKNSIVGSPAYRLLVKMVGPFRAEMIGSRLRYFGSRIKIK